MTDGVHVRVGAERYAFDVASVREVEDRGLVTPVPGAPSCVAGVRSLRGTVLPVIELAVVLGADAVEPGRFLVVVEADGLVAGLAVQELVGVDALPTRLDVADASGLVGRALIDEELVGVLDAGEILGAAAAAGGG